MEIVDRYADVSVVAANYNNEAFLRDFFEAWVRSTQAPTELIFVDDGSKDDSLSIARQYQSKLPYLIIIELGSNRGFANALNIGIERATCKYIMRIDPDDVVHPERLREQLDILENESADVVGSDAIIFHSSSGQKIGLTNFPHHHVDISKTILRGEHGVLHPTVMARADLFKLHPYIQDNVPAEDYDIFARMLNSGARFHNIKKPLLRYRVHQRSASNILPYTTIEKTFLIRDKIFGTKTNKAYTWLYFFHIKFYRQYLYSTNRFKRIVYILLSSLLRPDKLIKRLILKSP